MNDRSSPAVSTFIICLAIIFFNDFVFGIDLFAASYLQKSGFIVLFILIFVILSRDHDKETDTLSYITEKKDQIIKKQDCIIELQKNFIQEWEMFCIKLNNSEHGKEIQALILKQSDELTAINSEDEN